MKYQWNIDFSWVLFPSLQIFQPSERLFLGTWGLKKWTVVRTLVCAFQVVVWYPLTSPHGGLQHSQMFIHTSSMTPRIIIPRVKKDLGMRWRRGKQESSTCHLLMLFKIQADILKKEWRLFFSKWCLKNTISREMQKGNYLGKHFPVLF